MYSPHNCKKAILDINTNLPKIIENIITGKMVKIA